MKKICLNAGHYLYTSGKRCLKSLDPNETREWILNDRILRKVIEILSGYEGYELLRLDDPSGKTGISLQDRVKKANKFLADIYISIHHNAGINGGSGGGIVAYVYSGLSKKDPKNALTFEWQKALYNSLISHTGLSGNRSNPLAQSDLYECRCTAMPAVLLELGFMDSKTDVPIILSEDYANKCAKAIAEVIVSRCDLKKKAEPEAEKNADQKTLYRVQVGAFSNKANAEKLKSELVKKGYSAFIVSSEK